MFAFSAVILGGRLDSIGRWILAVFDYRVWGIIALIIVLVFFFWRQFRYKSWPTGDDCFQLGMSLTGTVVGITIMLVFLFTKPPAIEMLSGGMLIFLGLIAPIVIFGYAVPRLSALFFPPEAPKPPQDAIEKE